MIKSVKGDILTVTKGHIVHGCNARGSMGKGIALSIKNKYPEVYDEYMDVHNTTGLKVGDVIPVKITEQLVIWNLITQNYYKGARGATPEYGDRYASYDGIAACFAKFNEYAPLMTMVPQTLNTPLIGAGLANGNWGVISSIITSEVPDMEKILWIYQ